MNIRTVAVWGAGAVGSYFIWGLTEKLGENLWVIAEGERRVRLKTEGLRINGESFYPPVRTPEEARGVDLLLVAVKYGALPEVAKKISAVVDDHTIVLSLLNGVDSEEILGASIGMDPIVYSMMQIASLREGNQVYFHPERTPGLFFGETGADASGGLAVAASPAGRAGQRQDTVSGERVEADTSPAVRAAQQQDAVSGERVEAVAGLLRDTPLRFHVCADIQKEIWLKYAFNVSMNLPQAIIGCGIGAMADSAHMAAMRKALRDEVTAVAAARGIDISEPSAIERMRHPSAPASRYSTLQDLDAKRPTEIEMFAGTVVRLGEELGIATPCNAFVYHAVRALEEKNQGRFAYE